MCQKSVLSLKFIDIIVYKFFQKQQQQHLRNSSFFLTPTPPQMEYIWSRRPQLSWTSFFLGNRVKEPCIK